MDDETDVTLYDLTDDVRAKIQEIEENRAGMVAKKEAEAAAREVVEAWNAQCEAQSRLDLAKNTLRKSFGVCGDLGSDIHLPIVVDGHVVMHERKGAGGIVVKKCHVVK